MGEIAEMMLDGTLCEGCGAYLDGEGDGIPRYCSRECASDRGAQDRLPLTRKQRADRSIDLGEIVMKKAGGLPEQAHKPWLCECGQRFRLESGARQHWRDSHGRHAGTSGMK
ncbi:hypothetical protein LB518_22995 [Mesorhizobium sp. BR1-1-16]|uniref:hypothetical protein n=1 Tax=Mesorhizobium sp. BR1-1-16 TaxID=2876653 RepID=UPI001CCDC970|nr:hypothetical protein [Mesorhizobium sp. BR1-1-16]MBZ9939183.1 hypothetical protein [Mesorhizobium sp. BR1-1-16]